MPDLRTTTTPTLPPLVVSNAGVRSLLSRPDSNNRVWKGGVLIPHSRSFFMKIPHPTFFFYRNPASRAQFWWIPLPGSSQILNPAPFFSEILDPVNTLPDPVTRLLGRTGFKPVYWNSVLIVSHQRYAGCFKLLFTLDIYPMTSTRQILLRSIRKAIAQIQATSDLFR